MSGGRTCGSERPAAVSSPQKTWERKGAKVPLSPTLVRTLAFETTPALDYVAGDATAAYTYPWSGIGTNPSRRVEEAVRQIVFLKPGLIVIFDRVEATRARFPKTWLLHSIGAPAWTIAGRRRKLKPGVIACPAHGPFEIEHGRGRLIVWPLLPGKRRVRAVGGKGFECWVEGAPGSDSSGGRNYPPTNAGTESGAWRLEISPAWPTVRDIFLTVLRAGLRCQPRVRDRYEFDVERHSGETVLTVRQKSRSAKPTVFRFRDQGRVEVDVIGGAGQFRHSIQAPKRVPRKNR